MHTPVLVDGEEVEPFILVFFRTQHRYLVVDEHPVQALIWDRACARAYYIIIFIILFRKF